MSVRDELHALCLLEARIAALTDRKDQLRRALLDKALTQFDESGAAPTWRVPNAGSVGLTVPKAKPTVVDSDVLMEWVVERYAEDPIETIRRVRPDWLDGFLTLCASVESTGAVISEDGELVPGVVLQVRPPYLSVRLTKEAKLAAQVDLDMALLNATSVEEAS